MVSQSIVNEQLTRNGVMKQELQEWEPFYSDVNKFIRPRKKSVDNSRSPSGQLDEHYSSVAPSASNTLGLTMADTLTPKSIEWFAYQIPESSPMQHLNKNIVVQQWFRALANGVFAALAQSNFYSVINEIYADFNSFATVCLHLEEARLKKAGFNGFNFRALPINAYTFEENYLGLVDTVFREYEISVRQLFQQFEDSGKIPPKYHKLLKKEPDSAVKCLSVGLPSEDIGLTKGLPFTVLDILLDEKVVVGENGFHEFPYFVGRWDKASGEKRGRGPAAIALADIKTLNELRFQELMGLQKAINPPLLSGEEGFVGTVQMVPNAIVYSRNPKDVRLMPAEMRLDLSSLKADQLEASIKDIYLVDQLKLPQRGDMTAEEVITRRGEVERLLGPTVSRFESEVLSGVLERCAGMMVRSGAVPEAPPELENLEEIDIVYTGQLSRAQKLAQVQSVQRWAQMGSEFAALDPRVLNVMNLPEWQRAAAPLMGVPPEAVKSANDQKREEEAQAAAQEAEKQKEDLAGLGDLASKVAPLAKASGEGGAIEGFPGAQAAGIGLG